MKKFLTPLVLSTALSHSVQANDTASIQGYTRDSTTRTLSINSSKDSLEKSLPEITQILQESYRVQGNNSYSLEQAILMRTKLCESISKILHKNNVQVGSPFMELASFFQKYGFVFAPSPMNIGNDRYILNHPLYKINPDGVFDISIIKFDPNYGLPIQNMKVDLNKIQSIIFPDIRERSNHYLDGLTISDTKNNNSIILLFQERIQKNASKNHQTEQEYKKVVTINEVSQVYFINLIPTKLFQAELNTIGIPAPKGITIHHLLEAFSDLCNMKFTNGGKYEIFRILQSKNEGYRLSHMILSENLRLYFPMMTTEGIIQKLQNMNSNEYSKLNAHLVDAFEQNILPTMTNIYTALPQKP